MTVRLRPHHLLCVLTYVGKGYSPAFTVNLTAIAGRLAAGEEVDIVAGPDDICAPLLSGQQPHCHRASVSERDRAAMDDLGGVLGLPVRPGGRLVLDATRLGQLRAAFATGQVRSACHECEWAELCTAIAQDGFAHAVIAAPAHEA
ncbi:DUF1284 domain-containing protein [Nitratireductor sp. CAU 1489]|uniref:DUF1284 domain-containing protein n=1 Tax=Nitratireductor arenosus TaxID=2682096 RepID=A0A844QAZ8_9HYPH|nr:DUF1284 domain-containing protein [Nitratireductor arenosus]MVA97216.1 DUF1284 domain-containing protein [Nitratireductor arenosus]